MSLDKIKPTIDSMFQAIESANIIEKMKDKEAFEKWLQTCFTMNSLIIDEWTELEGKEKEEVRQKAEQIFLAAIAGKLYRELDSISG